MDQLQILYLEDSSLDADRVRHRLIQDGLDAHVAVVQTPEEFVEQLRSKTFDLVMSDHAVPGFTGRNALEMTQQLRPGVPVLLLSSRVEQNDAVACLESGAADYLAKTDLWKLSHVIRHVVARPADYSPVQRRSRDRWETLVCDIQRLSMCRDLTEIVDIVRHAARKLAGADGATFVLRDGDRCHYVDENAISPLWKGKRFHMSTCISGWVMINCAAAIIPDIYKDARVPHDAYRPTFVKSLAMVPIRAQSPMGAIGVYWATPHHTSIEELALITSLADATSLAMENVQLYEGLEQRVQDRTVQLESANKELEAFSYSVSHDLRSPVSAVKGYVEYLLEKNQTNFDSETIDVLNRVEIASRQMESLIDSLIALAKHTASELERWDCDFSVLAKDVVELLCAKPAYARVQVSVAPGLRCSGDPRLVRVVLDNLISNAMKFSQKEQNPKVEIGVTGPNSPTFYVRDNGIGFDMAQVKRVFAPFHRLHSDAEFSGTGIGLATVQRIIHRHGGQIWADSAPGKGSTFYFTLGSKPVAHS